MQEGIGLRISWVDLCAFLATGGATLLLCRYLHGAGSGWMPWAAAAGGLLAGVVVRRAALAAWPDVPAVLARPVIAGVLAIGAMLVALATLGGFAPSYWLLVGGRALTLAAVAALLAVALAALAASHRRYASEVSAHRAREAELAEAAAAARLSELRARMQPHFLFNALNTLAELVHEDPARAEEFVEDLAHLLRHALRASSEECVPLAKECEVIERTLRIERARFGERLGTELSLDPNASVRAVPGLLLQPLVENAVRHAIATRPEGGRVRVTTALAGGALVLAVEDDGPGIPAEVVAALERGQGAPGGGSGGAGGALANIRARLSLSRGGGTLRFGRSALGGARVEVILPATEAP